MVRYSDSLGDWFVFPGGGQQHGEDLHETLVREVEEETGIKPAIGKLRFVRECIAARHQNGNLPASFHQLEVFFDCYLADGAPITGGKVPDPGQLGVEWRSVAELRQLRFFPAAILDLLEIPAAKYVGAC